MKMNRNLIGIALVSLMFVSLFYGLLAVPVRATVPEMTGNGFSDVRECLAGNELNVTGSFKNCTTEYCASNSYSRILTDDTKWNSFCNQSFGYGAGQSLDWADSLLQQGWMPHESKMVQNDDGQNVTMIDYPYIPVRDYAGWTAIDDNELVFNVSLAHSYPHVEGSFPWFNIAPARTTGICAMFFFNVIANASSVCGIMHDGYDEPLGKRFEFNYTESDKWDEPNVLVLEVFFSRFKNSWDYNNTWQSAEKGDWYYTMFTRRTTHDYDYHDIYIEGEMPSSNTIYDFSVDIGKRLRDDTTDNYEGSDDGFYPTYTWGDHHKVLGYQLMGFAFGNEAVGASWYTDILSCSFTDSRTVVQNCSNPGRKNAMHTTSGGELNWNWRYSNPDEYNNYTTARMVMYSDIQYAYCDVSGSSTTNYYYPNGKINVQDVYFEGLGYGKNENDSDWKPNWDIMQGHGSSSSGKDDISDYYQCERWAGNVLTWLNETMEYDVAFRETDCNWMDFHIISGVAFDFPANCLRPSYITISSGWGSGKSYTCYWFELYRGLNYLSGAFYQYSSVSDLDGSVS